MRSSSARLGTEVLGGEFFEEVMACGSFDGFEIRNVGWLIYEVEDWLGCGTDAANNCVKLRLSEEKTKK
jgi:hypothetical protein